MRGEDLVFDRGEACVRWFASSAHSRRGFCDRCGTTLFYVSDLAPGEVHIARACAEGEIDRAPACHVFFDAAVDWAVVGDALPRLDRHHAGLAKFAPVSPRPPSKS